MPKAKAKRLTPKQRMVVDQLIKDPSLKLCAEVTGVSYIYVRKLHLEPFIMDLLDAARKEVTKKAKIDAAWVLKESKRVYERCMQDVPVRDNNGEEIGEYRFEHAGANKALENIGKHVEVQAWVDKKEVVVVQSDKEMIDELEELIGGGTEAKNLVAGFIEETKGNPSSTRH